LLPRRLVLKERRKTPLFNGAIECRLFGFELFARRPDAPG
jgi:putative N6-adenine-specific DNA methylase